MQPHSSTSCNTDNQQCCLKPAYMEFSELHGPQFNSILYPKGMDIGRCRGVYDHSMIRINEFGREETYMACCLPTEYVDFRVLVNDEKETRVVVKTVPHVKMR